MWYFSTLIAVYNSRGYSFYCFSICYKVTRHKKKIPELCKHLICNLAIILIIFIISDQSRVTGVTAQKGGSPVRNQVLQEKTQVANLLLPHVKHSAKGVEALGVLVQYLVFNVSINFWMKNLFSYKGSR